jgi:hypothetical protein
MPKIHVCHTLVRTMDRLPHKTDKSHTIKHVQCIGIITSSMEVLNLNAVPAMLAMKLDYRVQANAITLVIVHVYYYCTLRTLYPMELS